MKGGSIRLRLWSAAAISILIALTVAGVGLRYLFERHVERRVESELSADLTRLIGATSFIGDSLQVAPILTDPRMDTPLSGYYWQVEDLTTGTLVRSRSLWDSTLALPGPPANDGAQHHYEVTGPRGALLVAVALLFYNWLVPDSQPAWIANAKSKPMLESIGESIVALLPEDPEKTIMNKLKPKDETDNTNSDSSTEPGDNGTDNNAAADQNN